MNEATTTGAPEATAAPKKPRTMGEIRVYLGDGTAAMEPIYCSTSAADEKTPVFGTFEQISAEDRRFDEPKICTFEDAGKAEKWIRDYGANGETYSIIAFKVSRKVKVDTVVTRSVE